MTPAEFIKKWKPVALTERAAAHTHFLDLCKLFEHEDPVSADPTGEWFAFEKGATKTGGGEGFADVWKKNFFAWEYKKKKRDLNAAMEQLVRYAAALENPPLQVYNQRPQWLADAHLDLDAAVAAAYGWPADISEEDALAKLLELNLARAGAAQELDFKEADDED